MAEFLRLQPYKRLSAGVWIFFLIELNVILPVWTEFVNIYIIILKYTFEGYKNYNNYKCIDFICKYIIVTLLGILISQNVTSSVTLGLLTLSIITF